MLPPGHEGLEGIIDSLKPEYVPAEFVAGAKVVDADGNEYTITAEELDEMVHDELDFFEQGVVSITLILDVSVAKQAIVAYTEELLTNIPF
jgi:hypothetical protein